MLLIHLASGALLQAAPQETAYVVIKKECKRKTRLSEATPAPFKAEMLAAAAETGNSDQPKTEVNFCSVTLAPPPVAISLALPAHFSLAETSLFRQTGYQYLSTSEEPDPPRFA